MGFRIGLLVLLVSVASWAMVAHSGSYDDIGKSVKMEEEMMMESESGRRQLASANPDDYISYAALARNIVGTLCFLREIGVDIQMLKLLLKLKIQEKVLNHLQEYKRILIIMLLRQFLSSQMGEREEVIAALVANVKAMIKADRKITSLKQLQGNIWQTGFQNKEIESVVYDDVPKALEKWQALGLKVYIYSSGSRLAQRLLFGNTNYGDLRKFLCGYFDTTIGNKKETKSYVEIVESLGVDDPSEVLFVTDVYQEATAAKNAGLEVMISVRPGNAPLPENNGFHTINSVSEI